MNHKRLYSETLHVTFENPYEEELIDNKILEITRFRIFTLRNIFNYISNKCRRNLQDHFDKRKLITSFFIHTVFITEYNFSVIREQNNYVL